MDCNCPRPTTLTTIVAQICGIDLKQIQRLGFQRHQADAPFTTTTILELANWQELITATDDTKIVITPVIGGDPVITPGEKITSGGGDNSTLNGVEEIDGTNPSPFACVFKSLAPATEASMDKLQCENGGAGLTVYLFLQGKRVTCAKLSGTDLAGIDIQSFWLSDRGNDGFGTRDKNNMSFSFPAGWSKTIVEPLVLNFNPLTDF